MANIKQLSARPDDLAPGHRLCGGCGASMAVRQVLMGRNDYDVVCCSATGCLEVSTSIYPDNAWNVPFIHNERSVHSQCIRKCGRNYFWR